MTSGSRVLLHIGPPKTGSTFVQSLMWNHRETLAREGVDIPGRGRGEHFEAGFDLRTVHAAPADPKEPLPRWEGAWDRLAAAAGSSSQKTVVISEERLAGASAGDAQRAVASLAPAEVHIVYTAREFLGLLPAAWQEQVKNRYTGGFEEWVSDVFASGREGEAGSWFWLVQDAGDVLRRWGSAVPADRIHVLTMPPASARPSLLWERFASLLGIDPSCIDVGVARKNSSLSLEQTEFLRRVNAVLSPELTGQPYFQVVRDKFALEILRSRPNKRIRPRIPAEVIEASAACVERNIDELRNGGYHVVGDLAELRSTPPDTLPEQPDPSIEVSDVLDAAVYGVAGLLEDMNAMRMRQTEARQEIVRLSTRLEKAQSEHHQPSAYPSRRLDRNAGQIVKEALVDLAGRSRLVGLGYRAYLVSCAGSSL